MLEGCAHVTAAVNLRHLRHVKRGFKSLKIRLDEPYPYIHPAFFQKHSSKSPRVLAITVIRLVNGRFSGPAPPPPPLKESVNSRKDRVSIYSGLLSPRIRDRRVSYDSQDPWR